MMVWCFGAWRWVASAISFRFAGVAPVRGGTHFLCRRKESKQRKRAHTASACFYPRAPDVPVFRTATFYFVFVASALNKRLTRFNHFFTGARQRLTCAHLRQTVCRFSHHECRRTECFLARTTRFTPRKPTHSLPQEGRDGSRRLEFVWVCEADEARMSALAPEATWNVAREGRGRWGPVGKHTGWRCEPAFFCLLFFAAVYRLET